MAVEELQYSTERKKGSPKQAEEDEEKTPVSCKTTHTDRLSFGFKTNNTCFLVIYIIPTTPGFVAFRLVQDDDAIEPKPDGSREE